MSSEIRTCEDYIKSRITKYRMLERMQEQTEALCSKRMHNEAPVFFRYIIQERRRKDEMG